MGQVRHGSATTTHAVRAAIQRSQASLAQLSQELGINPKTVAKWRKRATVEDMNTGPTAPRSTCRGLPRPAAWRRRRPVHKAIDRAAELIDEYQLDVILLAAGADGLFLESHPNPEKAISDGPNQIPLEFIEDLLVKLIAIHHASH